MKLTALEISGFRGFTQNARFDLAANAVIVVGSNGQGKTSFFDSILWALTGSVPRLKVGDNELLSLFSDTGEIRVGLRLQDSAGAKFEIIRSFNGESQNLRFKVFNHGREDQTYSHDSARLKLIEYLWPGAVAGDDLEKTLASAYVRSIYLQQDLVRQFIDADNEQQRFNVVGELVGAGRVTELQLNLERSKAAWVRSCTIKKDALEIQKQRLTLLVTQLAKLGNETEGSLLQETWEGWWMTFNSVLRLGPTSPSVDSHEAATALDTAMRRIQSVLQSNERNRQTAISLTKDTVARLNAPAPRLDLQAVEAEIARSRRDAENLRKGMLRLQENAAEVRRTRVQIQEERSALKAFAQIALKHLDERCPVCQQTYDIEATRKRLTDIANRNTSVNLPDDNALETDIKEAASLFSDAEKRIAQAQSKLQAARRDEDEMNAWFAKREMTLQQLGVKATTDEETKRILEALLQQIEVQNKDLLALLHSGEKVALTLVRATEQARKLELQKEIQTLMASNAESSKVIEGIEATERLASSILDGLREAGTEVINNQLDRIEPLLQRIYSRVDVHPAFKMVKFRTQFSNRRGKLFTSIGDRIEDVSTDSPGAVLSSSQMNALAVAIFLSLNLGLPGLPLESVLLDDPLQSLDDVNLLGLIDLLRRTKDQRQLLVSTHDSRFGKLLERKLRAVEDNQRTTIIEFSGWQRSGPIFSQRDVTRDERPMRMTAAS
jgi:DNA repair exonuclease SbcCD ATPase subunit